jgi:uncharacterized protein YjhX (UPF0386 family)
MWLVKKNIVEKKKGKNFHIYERGYENVQNKMINKKY